MATTQPSAPRQAPRQRKKERQLLRANHHQDSISTSTATRTAPAVQDEAQRALEWLPLSDTQAATCPVVFTPDAAYCFIASGSSVKIYSVATTELMSTLSLRPFSSASSSSSSSTSSSLKRALVTALLINPSNPRQLLVGSTDAKLRVWDYLEGRLLRTLEMGTPVVHAVGNANLPDQLYVALAPPEEDEASTAGDAETKALKKAKNKGVYGGGADEQAAKQSGEKLAGVYLVSLRAAKSDSSDAKNASAVVVDASTPVQPARRVRLAFPRAVRTLALSPTGSVLASLTPHAIHLCRTDSIEKGFSQSISATEGEELTTLAFHPTENFFATGNTVGQIRLWYNVLGNKAVGSEEAEDEDKAASTSVLHWHAHAVSALSFTPNGAYLLSGGQEAVMVLWQLHSGHQEYVPRLGAPILTLTVLDSGETGEQQVAARLKDGSVVFVGSQKLKIVKTITGLKADVAARAAPSPSRSSAAPTTPLALDPSTSSLVLPASHPSSLQFYSPTTDSQTLELEISPSNRVSSADANRVVEPTRVERVAFSTPEKEGGGYWMATLDSWGMEGYASVRQLKFWRKKADGTTFALSTRIDRPHDSPITSLSFSPSSASPLLLTTSLDGRIKAWAYNSADSSWRCRLSLLHRSSSSSTSSSPGAPVASAWSHDGSLFAVAHLRSVTLWSIAGQGELVHSFPSTSVGRPKSVEFVNKEGTQVLVAGSSGTLCWDLLTLEETWSSSVEFATVKGKKGSDVVLATEDASNVASTSSASAAVASTSAAPADTSLLYLLDASTATPGPSKPRTRPLPFPVRQALWLPTASSSSTADLSLAVASPSGQISLLGSAASSSVSHIAPSRLPTAGTGAGATVRLFDEIFGVAEDSSVVVVGGKGKGKAVEGGRERQEMPKLENLLLDTPAHSLPPIRMLWRDLLYVPRAPVAEVEQEEGEGVVAVKGGEGEDGGKKEKTEQESTAFASVRKDAIRGIFGKRLGFAVQ